MRKFACEVQSVSIELSIIGLQTPNSKINDQHMTFPPTPHDTFSIKAEPMLLRQEVDKSLFLANLSHELKTSLSAVLGAGELLQATPLNAQQSRLLRMMQEAGGHLMQILGEVLDSSKLSADRLTLHSEFHEATAFMEKSLLLFDPLAKAKGLKLYVWMDVPLGCLIEIDAQRLTQVFSNLLSNAIKFTAKGHVLVHAQLRTPLEVPLTTASFLQTECSSRLVVKFIDTGCGIAKEHLSQLFLPFSQVGANHPQMASGTGLGLSIAHQLSTLMGGQLRVSSTVGEGSEFELSLPLRCKRSSDLGEPLGPRPLGSSLVNEGEQHPDTRQEWVLGLSFEDELLQRAVQFHLNAMDCQTVVLEPKGTKQAQQAQQAQQADVDCIMTDHADWSSLVSAMPHSQRLQSLPRIEVKSDGLPIQLTPQVSPATSDQVIQPTLMFAPFSRTELRLALSQAFRLEAHGESAAVVSNALSTHEHSGKDLAGLRVLLVEDNVTLSLVYQALLASMGCVSESADNGQQALALVRHSAFDLVLMDCHLPELDGFEATKAIRRWELDQGVKTRLPIIALTASDALEDQVKSIASGMDGFCAKPLTRAQLLATIKKACSAPGQARH